ncbi:hypothetical protein HDU88_005513 [Geranomyces variabilis]|nr:hypothetical protein HDU88_005513 [Geranomyces variabilis]
MSSSANRTLNTVVVGDVISNENWISLRDELKALASGGATAGPSASVAGSSSAPPTAAAAAAPPTAAGSPTRLRIHTSSGGAFYEDLLPGVGGGLTKKFFSSIPNLGVMWIARALPSGRIVGFQSNPHDMRKWNEKKFPRFIYHTFEHMRRGMVRRVRVDGPYANSNRWHMGTENDEVVEAFVYLRDWA